MIPLNDFGRFWADIGAASQAVFAEVGQRGWYILDREVEAFEAKLADTWGLAHAVGVGSGLDALEISLRILGCKAGDRVLTTPVSAFATTLAIVKLGAIPVFVDVDQNGLIDLDRCEQVLARRREVRYLVPVHLYGQALDAARLVCLRERFGCRIVEDCAQSVGARRANRSTGLAGEIAATSFYPTKNLGALGDGGAILTNDPEHARIARSLRNYGESSKYKHDYIGYNSRLDELHAALLGRVFLPKLEAWTTSRRQIAAGYRAGLKNPAVRTLQPPPDSEPCWHLFPVFVDPGRKASFRDHLSRQSVGSGEHYPTAIPDQAALANTPYEVEGDLKQARLLCGGEVSLPIHPYLTSDEAAQVVEAVNSWPG